MLLEYTAFSYFLYRLGLPLLQALQDPRKFEEERLRKFSESNVWAHICQSIFHLILLGGASLVAWRRADLGFIWLGFAVLPIGLTILVVFAWTFNKFNPMALLDSELLLSDDQLDGFVKSRLRKCALHFMLLIVWCYSWRHLII